MHDQCDITHSILPPKVSRLNNKYPVFIILFSDSYIKHIMHAETAEQQQLAAAGSTDVAVLPMCAAVMYA